MELASVFLIAYSVYRIVEMAGGPSGSLFQSQIAFMIINGLVPFVAALLLTVLHPGAAFGSAWGPTSPIELHKRRNAPPPLSAQQRPEGYKAHLRYDPDIRKQISPTSQRHTRTSSNPSGFSTSPGLPSNPKPAYNRTSPMPSPTGTVGTAGTVDTRHSIRTERRSNPVPKKMVEKDVLW